jgi:hypothetical protein
MKRWPGFVRREGRFDLLWMVVGFLLVVLAHADGCMHG